MDIEKKDYFIEDLLKETDRLIGEIGDPSDFFTNLKTDTTEAIHSEIRQKALQSIDEVEEFRTDGYFLFSVSHDEMQVHADFYPPSEGRNPLTRNEISSILQENSIIFGVDHFTIDDALFKCNTELVPITGINIAQGTKPIKEIPEHLELAEDLTRREKKIDDTSTDIDYKKRSPFVLVKKGDILAYYIPTREGRPGFTVTGKTIPFETTKQIPLKPGKNTYFSGDTVQAGCDGRFTYTKEEIWVNEVLIITGDVDYSTGHIKFPGDVLIKGEIQDGFKVNSGGSIFCAKTMDASEVECSGDIIVNQGIIGKRNGTLKTEGSVKAKFVENCYIQSKNSLFIEVCIINSSIHTHDQVKLGVKGVIVGGKTYAQNGLTAAQLGSSSGTKTEIYCGIDYSVEQKLEWIRDKNIQLATKLSCVRKEIKRNSHSNDELIELRDKLQAAVHNMNEASSTLINHLDKNEDVSIIVKGSVFPGVYIEICHCSFVVDRMMTGVEFKLDKSNGRVVANSIRM